MAPPDVVHVFLGGIRRVVDQDVGPAREVEDPTSLGEEVALLGEEEAEPREIGRLLVDLDLRGTEADVAERHAAPDAPEVPKGAGAARPRR